jgi:DNA-binding CsgD family transcriptional regulator
VVLAWTGASGPAESILERLGVQAETPEDQMRIAVALAHLRFWGQGRVKDAIGTLDEAERSAPDTTEPIFLARVVEARSGIVLNVGRPYEALQGSKEAAIRRGLGLASAPSASTAAAALGMLGRCEEALNLVDAAMPAALVDEENPLAPAQLLLSRCAALGRLGQLAEAQRLAETCRQVAIEVQSLDGTAVYGIASGDTFLLQGRPASAARRFRDAAGLLDERDALGYRPWALAGLATARALLGDESSAIDALAESERVSVMPRYYQSKLCLARSAVRALEGRQAEAVAAAAAGAEWCATAGMVIEEALSLHAWIRLEPAPEAIRRLGRLAPSTESPLVAALASHAEALHSRDADRLMACAEELAGMGAWLLAVEAEGEAALRLADSRRQRESNAAVRTALGWYAQCEGARSPLTDRLVAPSGLTSKELEVARLAALGYTSKQIAERLVVSIRTVDAHLYRVYAKLGIHDRSDLAAVLVAGARS